MELLNKIERLSDDEFIVEGRWCIEALIESETVQAIGVIRAEGTHADLELPASVAVEDLPADRISKAMGFQFHRGLIAIAKRPPSSSAPLASLLVTCIDLADASNLGAIIRTAAALGVGGILLPENRGADVWSRKAIRTSSGAVFRLPIYQFPDLYDAVQQLKEVDDYQLLGGALGKTSRAISEFSPIGIDDKRILLFGTESDGLDERWQKLCCSTYTIPMHNQVDSLNVAACAAIAIHQLGHRR